MSAIDIGLIVFVGGFVLAGLWFGLIHMIGSILGFALGIYAAGHYYAPFATWASGLFGGNLNAWKIASVFIIFVLVARFVGLIFYLLNKIFKFIAIIPFLSMFNRLLGAALGFIEGIIAVSLLVYFASRFPVSQEIAEMLRQSKAVAWFNVIGMLLAPLLPMAVRAIKSVL